MLINIVILLVGYILYLFSPNSYNLLICTICLVGFLITSWDLLKDDFKKKEYINFNTFFLTSFFLTSFCFPVFVMSSNSLFSALEDASMVVFRYVNYSWITKATCLCLISVSLYSIGYKYFKNKQPITTSKFDYSYFDERKCRIALVISAILVLANIAVSLSTSSFKGFSSNSFLYEIYDTLLAISLIARWNSSRADIGINTFIRNNYLEIVSAVVICLLLMSFNERGMALSIILIVTVSYSLYKKFSIFFLFIMMAIGSLSMYAIRLAKMGNVHFSETNLSYLTQYSNVNDSPLLIFSDLLGAEMELCVSYEIKETQGLQKPEQLVLIPFMPFPFLPTIASHLFFNTSYDDARAAQALNVYMSDYGATFGKHCVGDVYMRWGIAGIFVFFLVFGYFVGKFCTLKDRNLYYLASFFILLSLSIYIPRSSLIDIIRPLFYIYIFSLLLSNKKSTTYYIQ